MREMGKEMHYIVKFGLPLAAVLAVAACDGTGSGSAATAGCQDHVPNVSSGLGGPAGNNVGLGGVTGGNGPGIGCR